MRLHFTLATRYLMGRKLRSALTTLAVMCGTLVIFSLNLLVPTVLQALDRNMAASGQVDLPLTHVTGNAFGSSLVDRVRTVEGVRAASGLLSRNINLPADFLDHDPSTPDAVTTLTLIGIDVDAAGTVRRYAIDRGRPLRAGDDDAAIISSSLAALLHLQVGDRLRLPTTRGTAPLTIVGLRPATTTPGPEEVLVTFPEAGRLLDQPGLINRIEADLYATDAATFARARDAVIARLGPGFRHGAGSTSAGLFANLRITARILDLAGLLSLFMGGFIIFNTFRTLVAERRRDIGMLRAVGATRRTVLSILLAEGLLQGLAGTLAGMALGYGMTRALASIVSDAYERILHLRLGPPVVTLSLVLTTLALGIGSTLLAALWPALTASRATPLEALRPAPATGEAATPRGLTHLGGALLALAALGLLSGRIWLATAGTLALLAGLVLVAPPLVAPLARLFGRALELTLARDGAGALASGSLARAPARAAITASSTLIGLAIVVAVAGLFSSASQAFLDMLERSLGSDYLLMPPALGVWGDNVGADPGLARRLRDLPGVELVSTLRYAPSAADGHPVSLLGLDPRTFPKASRLEFTADDPADAYAALARGGALIANGPFAAAHDLQVGDRLTLTTPHGPRDYRVAGIALDFLNAKLMTAYLSQADLEADFQRTEDVLLQLNRAPGADAAMLERRIDALLADYPQFHRVSGRGFQAQTRLLLSAFNGVLYLVLGVLAVPALIAMFNTLAIGVLERLREIGVLRAIGSTRGQVRRMVLTEALILAAIGIALGQLAGLYLGYVLVGALNAGGYPIRYVFPAAGVIAALAAGLLFGALAAAVPARQAARLEITVALRYE